MFGEAQTHNAFAKTDILCAVLDEMPEISTDDSNRKQLCHLRLIVSSEVVMRPVAHLQAVTVTSELAPSYRQLPYARLPERDFVCKVGVS